VKIALFKSRSLIGRLIRWQTRGEFSHAALVTESGAVYESREFIGVRKMPSLASATPKCDKAVLFTVDIDAETEARVARFCESHLGEPYDYLSVARFISRRKEAASSRSKWFCSELVFDALKYAGVELFRETSGWEVSPDLLKRSPLVTRFD